MFNNVGDSVRHMVEAVDKGSPLLLHSSGLPRCGGATRPCACSGHSLLVDLLLRDASVEPLAHDLHPAHNVGNVLLQIHRVVDAVQSVDDADQRVVLD